MHTKISGKEYYDKRYLINRLPQNTHPEVMEETGLSIRNIIYFDNQPWPYPCGLMMGFVADYAGGEIKLQDEESSSGAIFTKENLPEIPRKLSMAHRLIDWWLDSSQHQISRSM